jgi:hypothetical protein
VFQETLSPYPVMYEAVDHSCSYHPHPHHHHNVLYFILVFILQLASPIAISQQVLT